MQRNVRKFRNLFRVFSYVKMNTIVLFVYPLYTSAVALIDKIGTFINCRKYEHICTLLSFYLIIRDKIASIILKCIILMR